MDILKCKCSGLQTNLSKLERSVPVLKINETVHNRLNLFDQLALKSNILYVQLSKKIFERQRRQTGQIFRKEISENYHFINLGLNVL